jgi:hypothetical protein
VIDAVRATFTALREGKHPGPGDLNVLPIGTHEGVFLGLDDQSRPHVLLATDDDFVPVSDLATLELGSRMLVIGTTPSRFLDIACLFEALADVFDYFVVAVVERLAEVGVPPAQAVTEVLEQWRQFLIAGAGPPGRDRLAALFGELVVLLDVVRAPGSERIDAWVGLFRGRHDFRRGATAVEVKTTRSHTSRVVTIHGEDQLLEPEGGKLFLHLVRLEEVPEGGRSVSSVVDEILAAGAPARNVFEALTAGGMPAADLSAAGRVQFDVRERVTFPIDADAPRIVPASFTTGARPVGVIDVSYRIDLDHVLDRALDASAYEAIVTHLSTAEAAS